uniref:TNFR-Cys domain-containing protein n=1 Tax=Phytophthora ramorum TaxID=164328 RepID=H3HB02_PHYRM
SSVEPCQAGFYSSTGSGSCVECPRGYYCDTPNEMPKNCSVGYYSERASTRCLACDPGYECPRSDQLPQPCPVGYYSEGAVANCRSCYPGYKCSLASDNPTPPEDACPMGGYCNPPTTFFLCPAGTFGNVTAGESIDHACAPCPEGYYCDMGTTPLTRQDCPAGSYCPTGTSQPQACPQGYYCLQGTRTMNQYPCQAGTYSGQTVLASDHPCPAGTYTENIDLIRSQDCTICPLRHACLQGTGGTTQTMLDCGAGFFCPNGTAHSNQFPCLPGTWSSSTSLSTAAECDICPKGSYCQGGKSSIDGNCAPGHYCPLGTYSDSQFPCPSGTYTANTWLFEPSQCDDCPPGYYCPAGSVAPIPCKAGSYTPLNNTKTVGPADAWPACTTCPAGSFCIEASVNPKPCGKGKFSTSGSKACSACEAGYFCNSETTSAANMRSNALGWSSPGALFGTCYNGTYCPSGSDSALSPAGVCSPGFYCPLRSTSQTQVPCPARYYLNRTMGQSEEDCALCVSGSYCPIGTAYPITCSAGYYCRTGISSPEPCPIGTYANATGLRTVDDCLPCTPGMYCDSTALTIPRGLCDPGYYCTLGAYTSAPMNYESTLFGSSAPTLCPPGTYNNFTGLEAVGQCVPCPPGDYCETPGLLLPTGSCHPGYYCIGGAAVPTQVETPAGSFSLEGATAPSPCPPGQYNLYPARDQCVVCPAGFYCGLPGTKTPTFCDSYGLSTSSGPCLAGFVCVGGSPVSNPMDQLYGYVCPVASYCPEGSGSAIPCPMGSFRAATGGAICPAGSYCSKASSAPKQCNAGTYAADKGQDVCDECPMGYFCDGVATSTYADCPAGHYCPPGTAEVPVPCPIGTFSNTIRLSNVTECQECTPGSFCAYCPEGTYLPIPCPTGTYSNDTGLVKAGDCAVTSTVDGAELVVYFGGESCPTGSPTCLACPAGFFCPLGCEDYLSNVCPHTESNPISVSTRDFCEPNRIAESLAVYASTSRRAIAEVVSTALADLLPEHQQKPQQPADRVFQAQTAPKARGSQLSVLLGHGALPCEEGFYCVQGSYTATPTGQNNSLGMIGNVCKQGHYCPNGTSNPIPCPPGTYSETTQNVNASFCLACPAGFICSTSGIVIPSEKCPPGFFCTGGESTATQLCPKGSECPEGSSEPRPCPAGTFADEKSLATWSYGDKPALASAKESEPVDGVTGDLCDGGHICLGGAWLPDPIDGTTGKICDPGYYCPKGSSSQIRCAKAPCPLRYYCPEGIADPLFCPDGTYGHEVGLMNATDEKGKANLEDCLPCDEGKLCNRTGILSLTGYDCPPGSYCLRGSSEPQPCPAGSYRAVKGAKSSDDCALCTAGSYCEAGSIRPSVCKARPGATKCTCVGSHRAFQMTDGYCICEPGFEFYDQDMILRSDEDGDVDCQPIYVLMMDRSNCQLHSIAVSSSGFSGSYDLPSSISDAASRRRRRLTTDSASSSIANPMVCLPVGSGLLFDLSVPRSYPIYLKDSMLNTNPSFDYGAFRALATKANTNASTVSAFAFSFTEPGTYVFGNSLNAAAQTIVVVMKAGTSCPTEAAIVPLNEKNLITVSAKRRTDDFILAPDWSLIVGLLGGLFGVVVAVIAGLYYFRVKSWTNTAVKTPVMKLQLGGLEPTKGDAMEYHADLGRWDEEDLDLRELVDRLQFHHEAVTKSFEDQKGDVKQLMQHLQAEAIELKRLFVNALVASDLMSSSPGREKFLLENLERDLQDREQFLQKKATMLGSVSEGLREIEGWGAQLAELTSAIVQEMSSPIDDNAPERTSTSDESCLERARMVLGDLKSLLGSDPMAQTSSSLIHLAEAEKGRRERYFIPHPGVASTDADNSAQRLLGLHDDAEKAQNKEDEALFVPLPTLQKFGAALPQVLATLDDLETSFRRELDAVREEQNPVKERTVQAQMQSRLSKLMKEVAAGAKKVNDKLEKESSRAGKLRRGAQQAEDALSRAVGNAKEQWRAADQEQRDRVAAIKELLVGLTTHLRANGVPSMVPPDQLAPGQAVTNLTDTRQSAAEYASALDASYPQLSAVEKERLLDDFASDLRQIQSSMSVEATRTQAELATRQTATEVLREAHKAQVQRREQEDAYVLRAQHDEEAQSLESQFRDEELAIEQEYLKELSNLEMEFGSGGDGDFAEPPEAMGGDERFPPEVAEDAVVKSQLETLGDDDNADIIAQLNDVYSQAWNDRVRILAMEDALRKEQLNERLRQPEEGGAIPSSDEAVHELLLEAAELKEAVLEEVVKKQDDMDALQQEAAIRALRGEVAELTIAARQAAQNDKEKGERVIAKSEAELQKLQLEYDRDFVALRGEIENERLRLEVKMRDSVSAKRRRRGTVEGGRREADEEAEGSLPDSLDDQERKALATIDDELQTALAALDESERQTGKSLAKSVASTLHNSGKAVEGKLRECRQQYELSVSKLKPGDEVELTRLNNAVVNVLDALEDDAVQQEKATTQAREATEREIERLKDESANALAALTNALDAEKRRQEQRLQQRMAQRREKQRSQLPAGSSEEEVAEMNDVIAKQELVEQQRLEDQLESQAQLAFAEERGKQREHEDRLSQQLRDVCVAEAAAVATKEAIEQAREEFTNSGAGNDEELTALMRLWTARKPRRPSIKEAIGMIVRKRSVVERLAALAVPSVVNSSSDRVDRDKVVADTMTAAMEQQIKALSADHLRAWQQRQQELQDDETRRKAELETRLRPCHSNFETETAALRDALRAQRQAQQDALRKKLMQKRRDKLQELESSGKKPDPSALAALDDGLKEEEEAELRAITDNETQQLSALHDRLRGEVGAAFAEAERKVKSRCDGANARLAVKEEELDGIYRDHEEGRRALHEALGVEQRRQQDKVLERMARRRAERLADLKQEHPNDLTEETVQQAMKVLDDEHERERLRLDAAISEQTTQALRDLDDKTRAKEAALQVETRRLRSEAEAAEAARQALAAAHIAEAERVTREFYACLGHEVLSPDMESAVVDDLERELQRLHDEHDREWGALQTRIDDETRLRKAQLAERLQRKRQALRDNTTLSASERERAEAALDREEERENMAIGASAASATRSLALTVQHTREQTAETFAEGLASSSDDLDALLEVTRRQHEEAQRTLREALETERQGTEPMLKEEEEEAELTRELDEKLSAQENQAWTALRKFGKQEVEAILAPLEAATGQRLDAADLAERKAREELERLAGEHGRHLAELRRNLDAEKQRQQLALRDKLRRKREQRQADGTALSGEEDKEEEHQAMEVLEATFEANLARMEAEARDTHREKETELLAQVCALSASRAAEEAALTMFDAARLEAERVRAEYEAALATRRQGAEADRVLGRDEMAKRLASRRQKRRQERAQQEARHADEAAGVSKELEDGGSVDREIASVQAAHARSVQSRRQQLDTETAARKAALAARLEHKRKINASSADKQQELVAIEQDRAAKEAELEAEAAREKARLEKTLREADEHGAADIERQLAACKLAHEAESSRLEEALRAEQAKNEETRATEEQEVQAAQAGLDDQERAARQQLADRQQHELEAVARKLEQEAEVQRRAAFDLQAAAERELKRLEEEHARERRALQEALLADQQKREAQLREKLAKKRAARQTKGGEKQQEDATGAGDEVAMAELQQDLMQEQAAALAQERERQDAAMRKAATELQDAAAAAAKAAAASRQAQEEAARVAAEFDKHRGETQQLEEAQAAQSKHKLADRLAEKKRKQQLKQQQAENDKQDSKRLRLEAQIEAQLATCRETHDAESAKLRESLQAERERQERALQERIARRKEKRALSEAQASAKVDVKAVEETEKKQQQEEEAALAAALVAQEQEAWEAIQRKQDEDLRVLQELKQQQQRDRAEHQHQLAQQEMSRLQEEHERELRALTVSLAQEQARQEEKLQQRIAQRRARKQRQEEEAAANNAQEQQTSSDAEEEARLAAEREKAEALAQAQAQAEAEAEEKERQEIAARLASKLEEERARQRHEREELEARLAREAEVEAAKRAAALALQFQQQATETADKMAREFDTNLRELRETHSADGAAQKARLESRIASKKARKLRELEEKREQERQRLHSRQQQEAEEAAKAEKEREEALAEAARQAATPVVEEKADEQPQVVFLVPLKLSLLGAVELVVGARHERELATQLAELAAKTIDNVRRALQAVTQQKAARKAQAVQEVSSRQGNADAEQSEEMKAETERFAEKLHEAERAAAEESEDTKRQAEKRLREQQMREVAYLLAHFDAQHTAALANTSAQQEPQPYMLSAAQREAEDLVAELRARLELEADERRRELEAEKRSELEHVAREEQDQLAQVEARVAALLAEERAAMTQMLTARLQALTAGKTKQRESAEREHSRQLERLTLMLEGRGQQQKTRVRARIAQQKALIEDEFRRKAQIIIAVMNQRLVQEKAGLRQKQDLVTPPPQQGADVTHSILTAELAKRLEDVLEERLAKIEALVADFKRNDPEVHPEESSSPRQSNPEEEISRLSAYRLAVAEAVATGCRYVLDAKVLDVVKLAQVSVNQLDERMRARLDFAKLLLQTASTKEDSAIALTVDNDQRETGTLYLSLAALQELSTGQLAVVILHALAQARAHTSDLTEPQFISHLYALLVQLLQEKLDTAEKLYLQVLRQHEQQTQTVEYWQDLLAEQRDAEYEEEAFDEEDEGESGKKRKDDEDAAEQQRQREERAEAAQSELDRATQALEATRNERDELFAQCQQLRDQLNVLRESRA